MGHLLYDWYAFNSALAGIVNAHKQPPILWMSLPLLMVRTALLDSMAIHARSLFHFAYPEGMISPDDILAADYVPDWATKCPPWPKSLDAVKKRVCTEVAHLSYERLGLKEEEALQWPLVELHRAITAMVQAFYANLPEALKDPPSATAQPIPMPTDGSLPMTMPRWPPPGGWPVGS
jgi:hypothetical protein